MRRCGPRAGIVIPQVECATSGHLFNTIFKSQVRTLRVEGKDITKHKPVIEKEDMTKITSNLKTDSPVGLQQRVFIDLMLHFGRRGREGLRELKRESFVIKKGAGV